MREGARMQNIFMVYMLLVKIIFSWVKAVKGITIKGAWDRWERDVVSEYFRLKLITYFAEPHLFQRSIVPVHQEETS